MKIPFSNKAPEIEANGRERFWPLHFGSTDYKPESVQTLPVVHSTTGEPWKGIVKPRQVDHPFLSPISHD